MIPALFYFSGMSDRVGRKQIYRWGAILTGVWGFALFPLVGVPALLQLIFSIIGAVKANQGQWWNYPLNIRFVR